VEEFRAHCGPVDVEMAKSLRPDTIRAKFGKNRIQNAVHCTDFKEDSVDELCYMFDILAKGE
jgi:nucleoside-diphosphate kinase